MVVFFVLPITRVITCNKNDLRPQSNGTTYVYDFPEMFRQSLIKMWRQYYTSLVNVKSASSNDENYISINNHSQNNFLEESSGQLNCTLESNDSMNGLEKDTSLSAVEKFKIELNKLIQSNFFSYVELTIDSKSGNLIEKVYLNFKFNFFLIFLLFCFKRIVYREKMILV